MRPLVTTFLLLLPLAATAGPPSLTDMKHEYVDSVRFFTVNIDPKANSISAVDTLRIPYEVGKKYCWQVTTKRHPVLVANAGATLLREELSAPTAANWRSRGWPGFSVSQDKRTAITEQSIGLRHPMDKCWEVSFGDPQGRYILKVSFDGQLALIVEFDVGNEP